MKHIARWKTIAVAAFATILPVLIALQPIVSYAGDCGGSHVGC